MITVLSGGTGTPKLLQGLKEVIDSKDITIVVNTLENEYFSGVYVSADIDTVLYTMADMINEEFWYGVKDDTFITHERLEELGTPELLRIGDIEVIGLDGPIITASELLIASIIPSAGVTLENLTSKTSGLH